MQPRFEDWAEAEERLRLALLGGFRLEPQLAKQEQILHGPIDLQQGEKLRVAVLTALKTEPTIGEAERSALQPLGPEEWAEAQSRIQSHLASPTAIPEDDLAVYVPLDVETTPRVVRPLEEQVDEVARLADDARAEETEKEQLMREEIEEAIEEKRQLQTKLQQEQPDSLPPSDVEHRESAAAAESQPEQIPETEPEPVREIFDPSIITSEDYGKWDLEAAMDPSRLTPLPLVAAALEAVGLDEKQFGFLLKYGTFAPIGRTSQIKISGLGMAEFSKRAADWFNALGASKFPIQVVDDGTGELTVYLLEGGPS